MNEKELQERLKAERAPLPKGFEARQEAVLAQTLEDQKLGRAMKKSFSQMEFKRSVRDQVFRRINDEDNAARRNPFLRIWYGLRQLFWRC